jgi:hypothetical protein
MTKNDTSNIESPSKTDLIKSPPASPAISKIQKNAKLSPKRSPGAKNILIRMLSPKKSLESSPSRRHIPRILRFGKVRNADNVHIENKENKIVNKENADEDSYETCRTDWTDTATESTYFGCPSDGEEEEDDYEVDPSVIDTFGFDIPNRRHLTPRNTNIKAQKRSVLQNGIHMIKQQSQRHLKRTPQKTKQVETTANEHSSKPDEMLSMSVADKILEEWASQGGAPLHEIPL